MYLFQILNMIYFGLKDPMYVKGGLIYMSFQTLAFLFLKTYVSNIKREDKVRLMQLEQYMYQEDNTKRKRQNSGDKDIGTPIETSRSSQIENRF